MQSKQDKAIAIARANRKRYYHLQKNQTPFVKDPKSLNMKSYAQLTKDEKEIYNIQQLDRRGINNDFKGRELDSYRYNPKTKDD